MKDAQGNAVTVDQQLGWIDSVGRTIAGIGYSTIQPGCSTSNMPGPNGGMLSFTGCVAAIPLATNFGIAGFDAFTGTINMLVSITLTNNTRWTFSYNSYGE